MHVLRDHWGTKGISQVDAAALKEAVDREPFQQIEAIASRSQSPTSATKSARSGRKHVQQNQERLLCLAASSSLLNPIIRHLFSKGETY